MSLSTLSILPIDVAVFVLSTFLSPRDLLVFSSSSTVYYQLFHHSCESISVWRSRCWLVIPFTCFERATKKVCGASVQGQAQYWRLRYKRFMCKEVHLLIQSVTGTEFSVVMKRNDNKWKLKRTVRHVQCEKENLYLSDFDLVNLSNAEPIGVVGESALGPTALSDFSILLQFLPMVSQQAERGCAELWRETLGDCVDGDILMQCLVPVSVEDDIKTCLISPILSIGDHLAFLDSVLPLLRGEEISGLSNRKQLLWSLQQVVYSLPFTKTAWKTAIEVGVAQLSNYSLM